MTTDSLYKKGEKECVLCGDIATHFPVMSFFGETKDYCCFCYDCSEIANGACV
jgi:hypothetical protein